LTPRPENRYGSDAIGGTVNAISRGRRQGDAIAAHGTAFYRYASAENSNLARVELGGEYAHRLGYLLGLSGKDFGDLEGGEEVGTQPRTGYDEWNGDIKLDLLMQNDSKLTLMHQTTVQNDVWRTHATIYGITWEGLSTGSDKKQAYDQTRHLTYLQYRGVEPLSFLDQLTANVSYQTQDEERSRVRSSDKSEIQGFTVGTFGAWLQGGSQTSVGYWTFGADWYHDDVESFQRSYQADGSLDKVEIQGPVADDAAYDLWGVFCQDDVSLSCAVDLLAGARYSYARVDASKVRDPLDGEVISVSGDWSSFVGNLRLLFHAGGSEKHAFFGGVSQGFRAPNLSDLTRFDTARSGEIETASPDLVPERFITYEAGFKARLNWLTGQVSYFYTSIDDMIIRVPTGSMIDESYEVTKMNSGEGYVQGVAFGAVATFLDMFRVTGSLSWLDGSVDAYPTSTSTMVEEPVSRLMPPTGELAVRWEPGRKRYWIEGALYAADRQDKLSTSDKLDTQRIPPGGTPGFAVLHLHAGWKIHEHLDISAAIENIGDEDYRIHGSGVNEPGRNLVFSMHTSF